MFTGIVKTLGEIIDIKLQTDVVTWQIKSELADSLELGASVMTNGVCLTVTDISDETYKVDIVPETLKCTTLGSFDIGDLVHLEPSLKLKDAVDGHFVMGHVDTTVALKEIYNRDLYELEFFLPVGYEHYIVRKGSVALNGVSLTVSDRSNDSFTVALIPETLKRTTFKNLEIGNSVNLEIDMVARYLEGMLSKRV